MAHGRMQTTAALAIVAMLAACDTGTDGADTLAVNDTMSMESDTAAGTWSDAQIFGLLARINGGRMVAAELVKTRATNADLRKLAETIDQAHVEMARRLNGLAQQMNLTPAAPDDSTMIAERNEDLAELQRMTAGLEWDRKFVDELEDWQEDTRDVLARAIESTQSAELRQALIDMRSTVEQHLQQTTQMKERLQA